MKYEHSAAGAAPKTGERSRRRPISLRARLLVTFICFMLLLLALLWVVQSYYLDEFYHRIKIQQIEDAAADIAQNIDLPPEQLQSYIEDIAILREICVSVGKISSVSIFAMRVSERYDADVLGDCVIHHLTANEYLNYYQRALANGGAYFDTISRAQFAAAHQNAGVQASFGEPVTPLNGLADSMIYAVAVSDAAGGDYLLLFNATVSPLQSVKDTLRTLLLYVTALALALALILSFVLARRLAQPLSRINSSAAALAAGDYQAGFDGRGYREVAELADTLNYAAHELSRTDQLQKELIANITHDLRTPLTMIGGYAEAMRDLPGENNAENAQVIIDESHRLTALVADTLSLSKLNAGVEELEQERFNFTAAVEGLVGNYRQMLGFEGYDIEFVYQQQVFVEGDESQLLRVVGNLLNNAVTFAGADKRIRVEQSVNQQWLRLQVIDHGVGIEPEQLPYIWERYRKDVSRQSRNHSGSGLGLAIVKGILELYGARYGVESELDQGSVFWFELPIAE
ncbi:MAG: HAMP domain-containing sensor histidine kinase [Bacillota bacterium]|nr:HAMP domain-containing sensor histidine kinase [Bacillota bacterium]